MDLMKTLTAKEIKKGQYIALSSGETIKVIHSSAETQSSQSAAYTSWYICGYSPGNPTRNIICDPNYDFEIIK